MKDRSRLGSNFVTNEKYDSRVGVVGKRSGTRRDEAKWDETKRNEVERDETKRSGTKRDETEWDETDIYKAKNVIFSFRPTYAWNVYFISFLSFFYPSRFCEIQITTITITTTSTITTTITTTSTTAMRRHWYESPPGSNDRANDTSRVRLVNRVECTSESDNGTSYRDRLARIFYAA